MNRLSVGALLTIFFSFFAACASVVPTLFAQSFPTTVHVEWTPAPTAAADGVTEYAVSLDGGALQMVAAAAVDPACACLKSTPFPVADGNPHTFTVRAVNAWGSSVPLTVTFAVKVAAAPVNGRVRVGS